MALDIEALTQALTLAFQWNKLQDEISEIHASDLNNLAGGIQLNIKEVLQIYQLIINLQNDYNNLQKNHNALQTDYDNLKTTFKSYTIGKSITAKSTGKDIATGNVVYAFNKLQFGSWFAVNYVNNITCGLTAELKFPVSVTKWELWANGTKIKNAEASVGETLTTIPTTLDGDNVRIRFYTDKFYIDTKLIKYGEYDGSRWGALEFVKIYKL